VADTVGGARVLERARSLDARFAWVVLAQLDDVSSCFARGYVVWYEDARKRRSEGHYTSSRADARTVFERRASGRSTWRGARPLRALASD